jgi:cytochrome P450
MVEEWFDTYGAVFRRGLPLGSSEILVIDPKATAHILNVSEVRLYYLAFSFWNLMSHSQTTYHVHWVAKGSIESEVGRGLLSADGDAHKRQRKSINPGFTSVKIREYSKIFTDCAHKV